MASPTPAGAKARAQASPLISGGGTAFADDFNRPDGPIGGPWVQQMNNGWAIAGQRAQAIAYWMALTYNAGSGDGTITATLVNAADSGYVWLVFRYVDSGDYWVWGKLNGVYQLGRFTGHNFVAVTNTGIAPQNGDVLAIVMNGGSITAVLNGTTRAIASDSTFAGSTLHGLGAGDGGGAAPLFDDFSYSPTLAQTGPLSTQGVAFSDNFNRGDGGIGGPWTQQMNGQWAVAGQQAQGIAYWTALTYSSGSGDGTVAATLVNSSSTGFVWLVFRYVDSGDYWLWGKLNGVYQLGRFSGHTFVPAATTGLTPQNGDRLSVVMQGASIVASLNGAPVATANDATFATALAHGIGAGDGGGAAPLLDDFSYAPTAAPPGGFLVQPAPAAMQSAYQPYGGKVDQVQTSTGNFGSSHSDLAVPGRGPSPALVRTYNSADPRTGPLGPGWTDNYATHLANPGDGTGDLLLVGPQGDTDRYTFQPGGALTAPPAVYTTLAHKPDGTYTATQQDQSTWTFDQNGRLTKVADRNGDASTLSYNGSGQLASVSDPAGRGSLTFAYNASGLLASVTDWTSRVVQYGYDGNGRLQTVTDRDGKQTTYAYDGTSSRLTSITDANGHAAVSLTYDAQGRAQTQTDALGNQTSFAYVANGDGTQTTTVTFPTTAYQPGFQPTLADTYDASGRLTQRVTKPSSTESSTESYGYDNNFDLTSEMDARGNTTTYCYDVDYSGAAIPGSAGNLTRVVAPAPAAGQNVLVTLLKYDGKNNLVETVAPKGVASGTSANCATNFAGSVNSMFATDDTYDASGVDLLSSTVRFTDPDAGPQTATTQYQYGDGANPGRVTAIIPPLGSGHATHFAYYGSGSQAGLLQSATDGAGAVTAYAYDAVGRQTSMTDPNGQPWTTSYDNEDRVTATSAPAPQSGGSPLTTQYQYDAVGNRTVVIDPNGQVTKYSYDQRNHLQELDQSPSAWTDPNASPSPKIATVYAYDHLGNLTRLTRDQGDSGNERATDYAYDGAGRLRRETQYPSWPTTSPTLVTTYAYDADGNQTSAVDALNRTTTFGYDALNRLTSITYSDGVTPKVAYAYDANGNRTGMTDGTGTTSYAADELGRITSITRPGNVTVGYRYDLDGNRTKLLYPDGTAVTSGYDQVDRLASLTDWAGRVTRYSYFPDGRLHTVTNVNGTTASYSYDNAQRLTQLINQTAQATTISQHSYDQLDADGNRLHLVDVQAPVGGGAATSVGLSYAYDRLSRLTGVSTIQSSVSYGYDPVGNRTGSTQNGSPITFAYDRADRLTTGGSTAYTTDNAGDVIGRGNDGFAYDQAGRLTAATVGGVASQYTYDGDGTRVGKTVAGAATSYVYDPNAAAPQLLTDGTDKYVWGLGLAYAVDVSNNVSVYHVDGLGSIRALTDGNGSIVQTYQTDAFGANPTAQGGVSQPIRYTGELADPETGLIYLNSRYYDPTTGRFMTPEPGAIPTGPTSRYTYADDNPTRFVDPTGAAPLEGDGADADQLEGLGAGMPSAAGMAAEEQFAEAATASDGEEPTPRILPLLEPDPGEFGVYQSVNAEGYVQYVGITRQTLGRRQNQHLTVGHKPADFRIRYIPGLMDISETDAHNVEEALIVHYRSNGIKLLNANHSIGPSEADYLERLGRGYQLLSSIGFFPW